MRKINWNRRSGAILSAVLIASCSQAPTAPTSASAPVKATAEAGGLVQGSAAGDVKTGPGSLEIVRLRMDRQTSSGSSILRQYANPGETYPINSGETIELWAEWDPAGVPRNPRFIVNWGEGEADFTGCGSCRLTHMYNNPGRFTVSARLDDLSATTVTRTFTLDSRQPAPDAPGSAPTPGLPGVSWTSYNFAIGGSNVANDCLGAKWVKQSNFDPGLFVGAQLCSATRYKLFLSSTAAGPYWEIADQQGSGQDHCQLIGGTVTTAIGPTLNSPPLPSGFYRGALGEPFIFATPPPGNAYRVDWYECGISIP